MYSGHTGQRRGWVSSCRAAGGETRHLRTDRWKEGWTHHHCRAVGVALIGPRNYTSENSLWLISKPPYFMALLDTTFDILTSVPRSGDHVVGAPDPPGQRHVLGHHRHPLGVDGQQQRVLKRRVRAADLEKIYFCSGWPVANLEIPGSPKSPKYWGKYRYYRVFFFHFDHA